MDALAYDLPRHFENSELHLKSLDLQGKFHKESSKMLLLFTIQNPTW
jgi:hypothetical protein